MARKKEDKDYTKSEKQLLISLINDYSLFGATDKEMIKMLSTKIGKKISGTLFYRLKKEDIKKRGEAEQWIDCFVKYQYIEFYRKRMEELELVQKKLLKAFVDETEKTGSQNKSLIYQLAKTIADISKVLAEFGVAPPVLVHVKNVISENYFNSQKNKDDDEIKRIIANVQNVDSEFLEMGNDENEPKKINYSQSVLKDYANELAIKIYLLFEMLLRVQHH